MADTQLTKLIGEQRKRLVASILGHAEREFFVDLTAQQQQDFRKKTLSAIDQFCDLMRDVVKITSDDSVVNTEALDLLRLVHQNTRPVNSG